MKKIKSEKLKNCTIFLVRYSTKKVAIASYQLFIVPKTRVHLKDVIADEPHQIGEVGHGGLSVYESLHGEVVDLVHVQGYRTHRYTHHVLRVVEELDSLRVEGEVVGMLEGRGVRVGVKWGGRGTYIYIIVYIIRLGLNNKKINFVNGSWYILKLRIINKRFTMKKGWEPLL